VPQHKAVAGRACVCDTRFTVCYVWLLQGTPILQATGANRAQINGTVVVPLQVR
jgi:hypothetical protein